MSIRTLYICVYNGRVLHKTGFKALRCNTNKTVNFEDEKNTINLRYLFFSTQTNNNDASAAFAQKGTRTRGHVVCILSFADHPKWR